MYTRLRALNLKWMQYKIDSNQSMIKRLCVMSVVARDLKAAEWEIPKEDQFLNVIRAPPDIDHWKSFKLIMAHNENIKTFKEI